MSPEQKRLARHALGLDEPKARGRSYRNRYLTHGLHEDWQAMVAAGLAKVSCHYSLTPTGAKAALDDGETLDPEDFP